MRRWILPAAGLLAIAVVFYAIWPKIFGRATTFAQSTYGPTFTRLSAPEDLELPSTRTQQAAALVFDADNDGDNDFIVASRSGSSGPYLSLYRREADGWQRYTVETSATEMSVGGTAADIDGDGDLDFAMGGGTNGDTAVWWWENPSPDFDAAKEWTRRFVKNGGEVKHHDQIFGDFDGDGQQELVFWNQRDYALMMAEIPADPHSAAVWEYAPIWEWADGQDGIDRYNVEGLAKADMDGDGVEDIVGGGYWFKFKDGAFTAEIIDTAYAFGRMVAGQLVPGGRPEVVMSIGDDASPLEWFQWDGSQWVGTLLGEFDHMHTLQLGDVNEDGHLDIFAAEMRQVRADDLDNPQSFMGVFYGDGQGGFLRSGIATGLDNHESMLADLDADGDLDILGKPFEYQTPALTIWLNNGDGQRLSLDNWQRHVVDDARPWKSLTITAADVNEDGKLDILTGGWWYTNPGSAGGDWQRNTIGGELNNLFLVHDLDGDDRVDLLGHSWKQTDSGKTERFVFARNDGQGSFTTRAVADGYGDDFLQGAALEQYASGQWGVALSWHDKDSPLQHLIVPEDPLTQEWMVEPISAGTPLLYEDLSAGDIDQDGLPDLLLGNKWLNNSTSGWQAYTFFDPGTAEPDRNLLVDINADGKLDALLGYERESAGDTYQPARLAWYEQTTAQGTWTEHIIADPAIKAPMSVDAADMDGDGDLDVVAGEHDRDDPTSAGLFIFENVDGKGLEWRAHTVYVGDEHHQGAQVVDIDGDGDLDILSIGWGNENVLLYENTAPSIPAGPTPTPAPEAKLPSLLNLFIQLLQPGS